MYSCLQPFGIGCVPPCIYITGFGIRDICFTLHTCKGNGFIVFIAVYCTICAILRSDQRIGNRRFCCIQRTFYCNGQYLSFIQFTRTGNRITIQTICSFRQSTTIHRSRNLNAICCNAFWQIVRIFKVTFCISVILYRNHVRYRSSLSLNKVRAGIGITSLLIRNGWCDLFHFNRSFYLWCYFFSIIISTPCRIGQPYTGI